MIALHACASWATDSADRKRNMGHYVALADYANGADAIVDSLRPGVTGVQKRYSWRQLEPSFDDYDFSAVAADLQLVAEHDAQLVVFVTDKSFKDERLTPPYLWLNHTLPVNSISTGTGSIAKRWDPYVVERMKRLLTRLGGAFDDHPHFEGLAIQETALGIDGHVLDAHGYTPEAYRDALIDVLRSAADAAPRSRVFWYANFIARGQRYLGDIAAAVTPYGVAVGGPDVLPEDDALQTHVYPTLRAQGDEVVVFNSAQYDSFRHVHRDPYAATRYWTPEEIFEFARDDLSVRYLFWNRVMAPNPGDSYTIEDAYPVMRANPLAPDDVTTPPRPPMLAN